MAYVNKLISGQTDLAKRYTMSELEAMPFCRLQDICRKRKIMTASAGSADSRLTRQELIRYLFRYYGKEENCFTVFHTSDRYSREIVSTIFRYGRENSRHNLRIPDPMFFCKEFPVMQRDQVRVINAEEYVCCIMLDAGKELTGIFLLKEWNKEKYLTCCREWFSRQARSAEGESVQLLFFTQSALHHLCSLYNTGKTGRISPGEMDYAVLEPENIHWFSPVISQGVLFIDFGLGNTAVKFLNEQMGEKEIYFRDPVCGECISCGACQLCPGRMLVDRIDEAGDVFFQYGHEAMGPKKINGCRTEQTFIREVKRLIEEGTKEVLVKDCDGNSTWMSCKDLVHSYLSYVIVVAERQIKSKVHKICFNLSEKQKRSRKEYFEQLLPEYEILTDFMPDQAAAVFYEDFEKALGEHRITVQNDRLLILDCGMGTSSLTLCSYSVKDTGVTYQLDIKTGYIREAAAFGGNHLTYRLLQFLKHKIADPHYRLPPEFKDAFDKIDETENSACIYEVFEKEYLQLEEQFPTVSAYGQEASLDFSLKIQNNFETLWNLAERIKLLFFSDQPKYCCILPKTDENDLFYEMQAGELKEKQLEFTIYRDEVLSLLAPEVYFLVKQLVEPVCNTEGILDGYRIRLMGQSSSIPLFRDALKEFTVGSRMRGGGRSGSAYLKMRGVEGALRYEQAKRSGRIVPSISCNLLMSPAALWVNNHDGTTSQLIACFQPMQDIYAYTTKPYTAKELEVTWSDIRNREIKKEKIQLSGTDYLDTCYEEVMELYAGTIREQADIDAIKNEETRIFVFADQTVCRIAYLIIARMTDNLYRSEIRYFAFQGQEFGVDFHTGAF